MTKLFLDASVIFSALNSKVGGSQQLIRLAKHGKVVVVTSQLVVEEVTRNLDKIDNLGYNDFYSFLAETPIIIREQITEAEIEPFLDLVEKKDAHVVAGAILTNCDYLVTLDKRHLYNPKVKKKVKEVEIVTPKDYLEKFVNS
jgi:putative PIN family toxin of toxin-antitoxin system